MNLMVAEEGEVEGEQVYNDADPYAYDPNEVQEDKEDMPLGRSLVIQRLLLTSRVKYGDQRNEIDVHEIYTIKYSHIYIFGLTFMLFCD